MPFNLLNLRALTLGSGCALHFIQDNNTIKPILVLTGINNQQTDGQRISTELAEGQIGIISSEIIDGQIITSFKQDPIKLNPSSSNNSDWLILNPDIHKLVYPRIIIPSLQVKNTSDALVVQYESYPEAEDSDSYKIEYKTLTPYEDYTILTRSLLEQYVLTLKPELVIKKGIIGSFSGTVQPRVVSIHYSISNALTSVFLDAQQVLKENSMPKVSYDVKPNVFNSKYCGTLYNQLGSIVRINDKDLQFHNVRGYISGLTLDLDNPDNDTVEIKNYKTKFEDLFSTITAQTEQMKKNSGLIETISSAFTSTGTLSQETLQSTISKVDLDYAFNNGTLTINEHNGIWGTSDTGVVAFRGGGIFTSTEQDAQGKWKWNTGITPEGINASLLTTGQLDTNLIKIYSGDNLRFQMNGDGIFAYKSVLTDTQANSNSHPNYLNEEELSEYQELKNKDTLTPSEEKRYNELQERVERSAEKSLDNRQYVLFNDQGLALIAKKGALVLNSDKNGYTEVLSDQIIQENPTKNLNVLNEIKRVEVSWDGFILRNWLNEKVFWADPDTGNLNLTGKINATSGSIGAWNFDGNKLWSNSEVSQGRYTTFVALNAGSDTQISRTPGADDYYTSVGSNSPLTVNTAPYCFWAGGVNPATAPFSLTKSGNLIARAGQIGGWTIAPNRLSSNVISLASTDSDISLEDTQWQVDTQGQATSNKVNAKQHAALWVHYAPDTTDASHSKLYISSNGYLYAKQLYFLSHKPDGTISTSQSVKILISNAQTRADKAYTKAADAYTKAEAALSAAQSISGYVTSVSLSKEGELTYTTHDSNGNHSHNGGQHTSST